MEAMSLVGFINEMVERYVTGYGLVGKKDYVKPVALPPVGTEPVSVSETACQVAAFLWRAQTGKEEDRYSFEELLTFMVSDSICSQMCAVALELQDDGDTESPLAKPVEG